MTLRQPMTYPACRIKASRKRQDEHRMQYRRAIEQRSESQALSRQLQGYEHWD